MSNNNMGFQAEKYHQFRFIGKEYKNKEFGSLPGAFEDLCVEIYNPGKEYISFENIHPERWRMNFFGLPPTFWMFLQCPPDEWVFLPHQMYRMTVPSGSQAYRIIQNYGDAMFKGNKLPSRPEAKKTRIFT